MFILNLGVVLVDGEIYSSGRYGSLNEKLPINLEFLVLSLDTNKAIIFRKFMLGFDL